MVTTAELIFWIVALVLGVAASIWIACQPDELKYEGRMDKIGGKGGR